MATTMARIGPEFQVGLPSHPVSKCRRSPQAPKRDGKSCLEALLTWTRECLGLLKILYGRSSHKFAARSPELS